MTDLNLTASVSAISIAAAKAPKAPRTARETTQDISTVVLRDAVKAVRDTDSALFDFSTSVAAMMIDSLSRKVARGEKFEPNAKDSSKLPTAITKSNGEVMFALQARCVYLGLPVFLGTEAQVREISEMPAGQARIAAARNYVDGTHVHEGRMLPLSVTTADLTGGKYPGAARKAMVSSFATARRMSAFLVGWFWNTRKDVIQNFGGRDLTKDDVESIRIIVRDAFGPTFASLEAAYKAGKPVPATSSGILDKAANLAKACKSLEDFQALANYFQTAFAQAAARLNDAEKSTGLDKVDTLPARFDDEGDDVTEEHRAAA